MSRLGISGRRAAAVALAMLAAGGAGSAWAAFSSTTSNGANSFSAGSDTTAPTVARAVAAKTSGATPGTIRQGGDYYVYAQVTDAGSGVATVTANTSSFDSGVTGASLSSSGGPWTVGGQSYNYRSAVLTANTPLDTGSSFSYSITATDVASNSTSPSYSVTIETYASVISSTSGVVSHWRLGDGAIVGDELNDSAGTVLTSHTGAIDASWTAYAGEARTALFTNENRLRKETGTGAAMYYGSGVPPNADYLVEADVHVKSLLASDAIGVAGRIDTANANGTYYLARYLVDSGAWQLLRVSNGSAATLGSYAQTLTAGQTYRVGLRMSGTSITVHVDGVQRISATSSTITAAGRGGLRFGTGSSTAQPTNTTGLHMDDFRVSTLTTTATDGAGTNNGTLTNAPQLNQPSALAGDTNRSTTFDGTDDYVRVTRQIQDSFSIEFWFKSTQGLNTNAQWWGNAGLVDAEVSGGANDFGTSLRSDGRITAGVGSGGDTSIVSTSAGYNDGNWHHVVFTRVMSSGALNLYVDGQAAGSTTAGTTSLTGPANIDFGRIQSGVRYYSGSIDEVAVYSSALSSSTVSDHYNAGKGTG